MRKYLPIYLSFFMIAFLLACGSEKVATFDGGSITEKDLEERARMNMYQLELEKFQMKSQIAEEMLQEKLLKMEAEKNSRTEKQLLEDYLKEHYRPVDESVMRSYYEANKSRIGQSYAAIREDLGKAFEQQARQVLVQSYLASLKEKYHASVVLKKPEPPRLDVETAGNPEWGNPKAKVTVVEFSDFECPYCKRIQPEIGRIKAEYGDKIRWVFRDFPLEFHEQSLPAHIAASCAAKQGKYFEFQQKTFEISPDLSPAALKNNAAAIGLDLAAFATCQADADKSVAAEIRADMEYGQKIGVNGTPTLFINGQMHSGMLSYDEIKALIEDALKNS